MSLVMGTQLDGVEEIFGIKRIRSIDVRIAYDEVVSAKVEFLLDRDQVIAFLQLCKTSGEWQKQKCQSCGIDISVTLDPDPFQDEVRVNHTPVWMCRACREQSARDI